MFSPELCQTGRCEWTLAAVSLRSIGFKQLPALHALLAKAHPVAFRAVIAVRCCLVGERHAAPPASTGHTNSLAPVKIASSIAVGNADVNACFYELPNHVTRVIAAIGIDCHNTGWLVPCGGLHERLQPRVVIALLGTQSGDQYAVVHCHLKAMTLADLSLPTLAHHAGVRIRKADMLDPGFFCLLNSYDRTAEAIQHAPTHPRRLAASRFRW